MKLLKLFTLLITVISLTSCEFTEEITFDQSGSGKYDLKMDMSGMMGMMSSMKDSTENQLPEKMDTIINMKDLLESNNTSISSLSASEKEIYNTIKDMRVHSKMDTEAELFTLKFLYDFKNASDLNDIQEKVKRAQKLQENKVEEVAPTNQKVTYSYSKKKFSRNVELLKLTSEQQAKFDEDLEQSAMFMGSSKYIIKYNFPKKIKSTNLKGAVISENGKTLTYETQMDNLLKNPKSLEFEIKF